MIHFKQCNVDLKDFLIKQSIFKWHFVYQYFLMNLWPECWWVEQASEQNKANNLANKRMGFCNWVLQNILVISIRSRSLKNGRTFAQPNCVEALSSHFNKKQLKLFYWVTPPPIPSPIPLTNFVNFFLKQMGFKKHFYNIVNYF